MRPWSNMCVVRDREHVVGQSLVSRGGSGSLAINAGRQGWAGTRGCLYRYLALGVGLRTKGMSALWLH